MRLLYGKLNKARVASLARRTGFASSSSHPRPNRLIQDGRESDNQFRWHHLLYQRFTQEDVHEGRLLPARIRYGDPSSNWSKYSKPWDVVFDNPGEGIAQILVADLPSGIPKIIPDGMTSEIHSCRPSHVPLPENYPHSEIWTYKGEVKVKSGRLGSLAKKAFQAEMSERCIIIHKSSV